MTQDAKLKAAEAALVYEAIRFANWAAGEGISPVEGEPAEGPEEFLFAYSSATGDEDWDTLAERFAALLRAPEAAEPAPSGEPEPVAYLSHCEGGLRLVHLSMEMARAVALPENIEPLVPASALASSLQRIADLEETEAELRIHLRNCIDGRQRRRERAEAKVAELEARLAKMEDTSIQVGTWLAAALDDPAVCDEMKADIRAWFEARAALAQEGRE